MRTPKFETAASVLAHFGVKGMRWGVRKDHATDTIAKSDRKAAKQNMKKEGDELIGRLVEKMWFDKTPMQTMTYSELESRDRTIAVGEKLYRTTSRKDEKYRDITYVATNQEDRIRYNAVIPSLNGKGGKKSYKQHYEATLEVTKQLTLPSEKARIDAFNELLDTPAIQYGKKGPMTGTEYLKKIGYGNEVKKLERTKLGMRHYDIMMQNAHLDTPLSNAYFKSLQAKGYNAIQDDNDRGFLSKDPLILLNPNGSVKVAEIKPLSNNDINKAQTQFTDAFKTKK